MRNVYSCIFLVRLFVTIGYLFFVIFLLRRVLEIRLKRVDLGRVFHYKPLLGYTFKYHKYTASQTWETPSVSTHAQPKYRLLRTSAALCKVRKEIQICIPEVK